MEKKGVPPPGHRNGKSQADTADTGSYGPTTRKIPSPNGSGVKLSGLKLRVEAFMYAYQSTNWLECIARPHLFLKMSGVGAKVIASADYQKSSIKPWGLKYLSEF